MQWELTHSNERRCYLQSSHLGRLDIHLKRVTKACDLSGAFVVSITIQTPPSKPHTLFNLLTTESQPFSHFDVLKLPKPIQNHLITQQQHPWRVIYSRPSITLGFTSAVGWIQGYETCTRMRKAICILSTLPFYIRDLSIGGFGYPFWYPQASWNQHPADTAGWLYSSAHSLNWGGGRTWRAFSAPTSQPSHTPHYVQLLCHL